MLCGAWNCFGNAAASPSMSVLGPSQTLTRMCPYVSDEKSQDELAELLGRVCVFVSRESRFDYGNILILVTFQNHQTTSGYILG